MTAALAGVAAAGGLALGLLIACLRSRRAPAFEPLPELPPRLVSSWPPPSPVHVLDEAIFHDGEHEGWWGVDP